MPLLAVHVRAKIIDTVAEVSLRMAIYTYSMATLASRLPLLAVHMLAKIIDTVTEVT